MRQDSEHTHGASARTEFSSADEGETEDFIRRMYVGNRTRFLSMGDSARFEASVATTAGFAADHIRSSADYVAECRPFDYLMFLALRGGQMRITSRGQETLLNGGDHAFYPLGVDVRVEALGQDVHTLRLPLRSVESVARDHYGVVGRELRFLGTTPISPAAAQQWGAVMALATETLMGDDTLPGHRLVVEELRQLVALTALHTFPNTTFPGLGPTAVERAHPGALRRAVAHIEDHAGQPLTLSEIAAAAGATGRALQYSFVRHYGVTPMQHLRSVRLARARADLEAADPTSGTTVTEIARRWGFTNGGRFAERYRAAFGESPSDTLRS